MPSEKWPVYVSHIYVHYGVLVLISNLAYDISLKKTLSCIHRSLKESIPFFLIYRMQRFGYVKLGSHVIDGKQEKLRLSNKCSLIILRFISN
jgi:hypothetical protein